MMAHWAEIDENNIVIRVVVTDNNDPNGDEGYRWLIENFGGTWIKTSYNGNIRKRFAGIGYIYNEEHDVFLMPKIFNSWVLDQETLDWTAPIEKPKDNKMYVWEEETISWREIKVVEPES